MEINSPWQGKRPRTPVESNISGGARQTPPKVGDSRGARGRSPCSGELISIFGTLIYKFAPLILVIFGKSNYYSKVGI